MIERYNRKNMHPIIVLKRDELSDTVSAVQPPCSALDTDTASIQHFTDSVPCDETHDATRDTRRVARGFCCTSRTTRFV